MAFRADADHRARIASAQAEGFQGQIRKDQAFESERSAPQQEIESRRTSAPPLVKGGRPYLSVPPKAPRVVACRNRAVTGGGAPTNSTSADQKSTAPLPSSGHESSALYYAHEPISFTGPRPRLAWNRSAGLRRYHRMWRVERERLRPPWAQRRLERSLGYFGFEQHHRGPAKLGRVRKRERGKAGRGWRACSGR